MPLGATLHAVCVVTRGGVGVIRYISSSIEVAPNDQPTRKYHRCGSLNSSMSRSCMGRSTSTLLPVKALKALSGSLMSDETILAGDGASLKYDTVRTKRPKSQGRSGSANALSAVSSLLWPDQKSARPASVVTFRQSRHASSERMIAMGMGRRTPCCDAAAAALLRVRWRCGCILAGTTGRSPAGRMPAVA